jgi:hypothetical protein
MECSHDDSFKTSMNLIFFLIVSSLTLAQKPANTYFGATNIGAKYKFTNEPSSLEGARFTANMGSYNYKFYLDCEGALR